MHYHDYVCNIMLVRHFEFELQGRRFANQVSIIINIIIITKVALAGRYNFLLCMLFSHSFTQKVHFALLLVNTISFFAYY